MKSLLVPFGMAILFALPLPAAARQSAETANPPQAETETPAAALSEAMANSLADVYVIVLEDGEGGMGSLRNEQGETALVVFLEPAAADEAMETPALSDMGVAAVPLTSMLEFWEGPLVFRGSEAAAVRAAELAAGDQTFAAPAFMVLTDGQETQIDMGDGPITPVMLNHDDANMMADQIAAQGIEAASIDIVPIEFGTIVGELQTMQADEGYRVFTHPGTVELIRSIENQQGTESQ